MFHSNKIVKKDVSSKKMREMSFSPLKKLLMGYGIILFLGLTYAFVWNPRGYYLSCPFRNQTGFLCGGCGVTRMCLSLLAFDWGTAYQSNPFLFLSLPFLAVITVKESIDYVKGRKNPKIEHYYNLLIHFYLLLLVIWTIYRNLP